MKSSNKIMDILNDIEYGFKIDNKNVLDDPTWDTDFNNFYYLQTPQELLNSKCGVCWDQVELERELFTKDNVPFKTYFIYIDDNTQLPSHTFLIYENNNKYYWFEHSWFKYRGIHEYNSPKEVLEDIINKFKKDQELSNSYKLYLYEYNKPDYHIKCDDFYKFIETQKLIIER